MTVLKTAISVQSENKGREGEAGSSVYAVKKGWEEQNVDAEYNI